jgi:DNA-binding NarL/FixJ family response regulator
VRRRRKPRGSAAPHGSLSSGPGPTGLVDDLAEREIIQQILELHAKGMGLREIARELDEAGLKCRQARQWHHWQVRNIRRRA